MDWKGKINFEKAITLNGHPHGVEFESSLPTFDSARDNGRVVFTDDEHRLYVGGTDHETGLEGWSELTPGGVGEHSHDDKYYRRDVVDDFFEPTVGGKKQIDWSNVINKQTEYTPIVHNNDYHTVDYITVNDVNFTNLSGTGSVGSGMNQVAPGNHNHSLSGLEERNASSVLFNNTASSLAAGNVQAALDELDSRIDPADYKLNKIYWVDNTRTDTYTEKGDISRPFQTIQSALDEISANDDGNATIILAQSVYDEDLIIPDSTSIKAIGNAELSGLTTFGNSGSGSNSVENILFTNDVTLNMSGTTSFSNTTFEGNGNLTIVNGSAEGDMSINTTSSNPALTLEEEAGEFVGYNCSFSAQGNTLSQSGGHLILSNSDVVSATATAINSTGGVVNISDTRAFSPTSENAIMLDNVGSGASIGSPGYGSSNSNPNILANIYVEGNVETNSSVTHIQTIVGTGSISGTAQKYPLSSMLTYDSTNSDLSATTVQTAIEELANSHSESQLTTTIYVDASRTYDSYDTVGAKGTIDRPFTDIQSAIDVAKSGDTIFCFKGAYSVPTGDIILPDNVNLIGMGQGKTNFYSKVINGGSGKSRLEHASFRGGIEINASTYVQYIFSNKPVTVNAGLQGEGFGIEVTAGEGTALTINSSDDVTLTLNTISTPDDAPAIVMNSGAGALYLQTSRVVNASSTLPTIDSNGGSVALLTTSVVNMNVGPVMDFTGNAATASSPNMLSQVFHSGGITAPTATVVEGVHGPDQPTGALILRPSIQIGYDSSDSGLGATTVKDALDEIVASLGSGNAADITYTGTLDSTNVTDALNELDSEKAAAGHNHNDIYYTQTEIDSSFVTKSSLSDVITHPLSAAYQEVKLTSASSTDESGLTPDTDYDFNVEIDGTTTAQTINPDPATAGYQELGLTGVSGGNDTSLDPDTYYYKVEANGNGLVEYNIVIDPDTQAEVVGTNDMSGGHDWYNYNADFTISVNGSANTSISFTINYETITDIVTEINDQIPTGAEAFNDGSDHIGIRTTNPGSTQTFTITDGTNTPLSEFDLTPGTYSGSNEASAHQDINLDGNVVDTNESGLVLGNTYDINADIDGSPENISITFSEATQGYQELGLSGVNSSTNTGLTENTTYYFSLNGYEYSINTPADVPGENEVTEITFTDDSGNSNTAYDGTYFDIYDLTTPYRVWFDVGNSSTAPSAPTGGSLVEIDITTTNTVDEIATAVATALDALSQFSSSSTTSPIVVTHSNTGNTTDAQAQTAPVTINITTQGSNSVPADLTWGNILTLLNDATSDANTPNSGEEYVWEIISGDIRVTDQEAASYSGVELTEVNTPYLISSVGASLETPVDGTDDDLTTYGSLIVKLNSETTGATWTITSGNIRLTSNTSGLSSSISLSNGTTNDLVANLTDIGSPQFLAASQGVDSSPAEEVGSVVVGSYDARNNNQNIIVNGTSYTMDQDTTTLSEVESLLSAKIDTAENVTTFTSGNSIGIRSNDYGSTAEFIIGTNGAAATMGISPGTYTGTDGTDTTWNNIIALLNSSTTSDVTWSIEGDDVRCTYNISGNGSTISLQQGTSGTDLYSTLGVSSPDSAVAGTDATTKYSDIINQLNAVTPTGATWTFDSGNLRITRDQDGSSYSVSVSSGTTNDVFTSLADFSSFGTPIQGYDSDTTTGSDLVGVQGIEDVQPTGKSVGEPGTLQEVLEGGVGQFKTSQPTDPSPGKAWFDASSNTLWVYNGTSWVSTTLS